MREKVKLNVFLDSEYISNDKTITIQLLIKTKKGTKKYVIVNELYKSFLEKKNYREGYIEKLDFVLSFSQFTDQTDSISPVIIEYLKDFGYEPEKISAKVDLYLFYSPRDVWAAIGYDPFRGFVLKDSRHGNGKIEQRRNISGSIRIKNKSNINIHYRLRDLAGWTNGSLKSLANSVGLETREKDLLNDYKSCMDKALLEKTETFFSYAINDTVLLEKIVQEQIKLINWVISEPLNLDKVYKDESIPTTTGKLVSEVFTEYLENILKNSTKFPLQKRKWMLYAAYCKLGLLSTQAKNHKENVKNHRKFFDGKNYNDILTLTQPKELRAFYLSNWRKYKYYAFSQASTPYFVEYFANSTGIFNSLVSGGRCVNERPFEYRRDYMADIDLKSCYGSALTQFYYPIGLPTIYARSANEKEITLGQFLKKNEKRLVPGRYTITVSGELSFDQDLIFSKITSESQIKKSFYEDDRKWGGLSGDAAHLESYF